MKNLSEEEVRNIIRKTLQERYEDDDLGIYGDNFDEFEFDNDAMRAAKADIESSGEEFEDLGRSKFEKDPKFKEKFKSAVKQANLNLPSDDEEITRLANVIKQKKAHEKQFGVGSLNEENIDRPTDSEGNPITLKIRVEHKDSGTAGRVERFIVGDDGEMNVKVIWYQDPMGDTLPNIVSTEDIIVKDKNAVIKEGESTRYMFFSNLEQMKAQTEKLLGLDENKLSEILESGHDWAQDHIATAKESMDQVFDFIMNEIKNEDSEKTEMDESNIRSHANGRGQNKKPSNFPKEFKRDALKEGVMDTIKSTLKGISPEQKEYNKKNNLPLDWDGTKAGYHEFITNKKHTKGTNETFEIDEEYDFNREEIEAHDKKAFEEEMDKEIFYVVDNDFNKAHYPDLIGKTFENPPGYAQVKVVKQGDIELKESEESWDEITDGVKFLSYKDMEIMNADNSFFVDDEEFETLEQAKKFIDNYSGPSAEKINLYRHGAMENKNETGKVIEGDNLSLTNKHGENAKPETIEESNDDRYERVVFLDGQEANHALNILMQDGKDEAMEYLKQWHYPGEHEGSNEVGNGSSDKTYEKDGYIMSWNAPIGYIGLVYDTYLDEDSIATRKRVDQRQKDVPLGQHAPHSQKAKK